MALRSGMVGDAGTSRGTIGGGDLTDTLQARSVLFKSDAIPGRPTSIPPGITFRISDSRAPVRHQRSIPAS